MSRKRRFAMVNGTRPAIFVLAAALFIMVAQSIHAQQWSRSTLAQSLCGYGIERFNVWPWPASAEDRIELVAGGMWSNGCTPEFERLETHGDRVDLFTVADAPPGYYCTAAVTPWYIEADAGMFPSGTYTASLYITARFVSNEPILCATSQFYVFDTVYQSYLPHIRNK